MVGEVADRLEAAVVEEPVGFACQSFAALSLDPPLVLFCPGKNSRTWPYLASSLPEWTAETPHLPSIITSKRRAGSRTSWARRWSNYQGRMFLT